jgi:urea carboxylase
VRLIGPKPVWARDSGGEAGLHPSNIHDNPYAVGAVDFTGDMPVILGRTAQASAASSARSR